MHGAVSFLKGRRRLNVLLTRAKVACMVLGDRGTLVGGVGEGEGDGGEDGESVRV